MFGTGTMAGADTIAPILKDLGPRVVVSVAAGHAHCVVCTRMGEVFTFGSGEDGRLGASVSISNLAPNPMVIITRTISHYFRSRGLARL